MSVHVIRALAAAVVSATIVVASAATLGFAQGAEPVWEALRTPGAVVVLRHSYAPGGFDPPDARLDDCSTQRNLDENGRAQAGRIGEAFRRHNIAVGRVLGSPRCRCLDTARLAFGQVQPWLPLQGALRDTELRQRLVAAPQRVADEHRDEKQPEARRERRTRGRGAK